jgi:hypothetical protein
LVALKKRSSISPYGVNISCNKKQLLRKEEVSADYDFSERVGTRVYATVAIH